MARFHLMRGAPRVARLRMTLRGMRPGSRPKSSRPSRPIRSPWKLRTTAGLRRPPRWTSGSGRPICCRRSASNRSRRKWLEARTSPSTRPPMTQTRRLDRVLRLERSQWWRHVCGQHDRGCDVDRARRAGHRADLHPHADGHGQPRWEDHRQRRRHRAGSQQGADGHDPYGDADGRRKRRRHAVRNR